MRILRWLLVAATLVGLLRAQEPQPIMVKPPKGWAQVDVALPGGGKPQFPTVAYAPTDHRNARVLLTIMGRGDGRVSDVASLRKFHEIQRAIYMPKPPVPTAATEFKFANGIGLYSTFEDPTLIGKPAPPGEYKVVSPVAILLDSGIVLQVSIFTDELTGPTMSEALALVQSITVNGPKTAAPMVTEPVTRGNLIIISMPDLDTEMGIPKKGLEDSPLKLNESEAYFSYQRNDGLMISGWLEPMKKFKGFREHWADEKGKIERDLGGKVQSETFATINGWQAVFYVLKIEGIEQPNLRASRVAGNTWLDVHISTMTKTGATSVMKTLLQAIQVGPKGLEKSPAAGVQAPAK
jgi:hypothetical protein